MDEIFSSWSEGEEEEEEKSVYRFFTACPPCPRAAEDNYYCEKGMIGAGGKENGGDFSNSRKKHGK